MLPAKQARSAGYLEAWGGNWSTPELDTAAPRVPRSLVFPAAHLTTNNEFPTRSSRHHVMPPGRSRWRQRVCCGISLGVGNNQTLLGFVFDNSKATSTSPGSLSSARPSGAAQSGPHHDKRQQNTSGRVLDQTNNATAAHHARANLNFSGKRAEHRIWRGTATSHALNTNSRSPAGLSLSITNQKLHRRMVREQNFATMTRR